MLKTKLTLINPKIIATLYGNIQGSLSVGLSHTWKKLSV